jgi:hypothetical protein
MGLIYSDIRAFRPCVWVLLLSMLAAAQNPCTVSAAEERDTTGEKMPLKACASEIARFSDRQCLRIQSI